MTARHSATTAFGPDAADYDAVTIQYWPDATTITLTRGAYINFLGPDNATLVESLLNRLRLELMAQVAAKGGS